jgi:hypothetical protein
LKRIDGGKLIGPYDDLDTLCSVGLLAGAAHQVGSQAYRRKATHAPAAMITSAIPVSNMMIQSPSIRLETLGGIKRATPILNGGYVGSLLAA